MKERFRSDQDVHATAEVEFKDVRMKYPLFSIQIHPLFTIFSISATQQRNWKFEVKGGRTETPCTDESGRATLAFLKTFQDISEP